MITIAEIARTAYDVASAYGESLGEGPLPWKHLPEWQSNLIHAATVAVLQQTVTTPEELHKEWLENLGLQGWTWGEELDLVHLTNPNMVPFQELSPKERTKHRLFLAAARSLMNHPTVSSHAVVTVVVNDGTAEGWSTVAREDIEVMAEGLRDMADELVEMAPTVAWRH